VSSEDDVRRLALALPEVVEDADHFRFSVMNGGKAKGFAWTWNERVDPKKPRIPRPGVLAVRVSGGEAKELLLASDPAKFFTEAHYDGFPAVLVRLAAVEPDELEELLIEAWSAMATRALAQELAARLGR